ncbi:hypothetical protein C7S14_1473 [Burkholderia cepacia]|nr:hypothetical protein C7S14_1473 [Burkholderia cepacia]
MSAASLQRSCMESSVRLADMVAVDRGVTRKISAGGRIVR